MFKHKIKIKAYTVDVIYLYRDISYAIYVPIFDT